MLKIDAQRFAEEPRKYMRLCAEHDRPVEVQCGDRSAVLVSRETWDAVTAALRRYVELCQEAAE